MSFLCRGFRDRRGSLRGPGHPHNGARRVQVCTAVASSGIFQQNPPLHNMISSFAMQVGVKTLEVAGFSCHHLLGYIFVASNQKQGWHPM